MWVFFFSSLATGPMKPSPYDCSVVHFSDSGSQSYLPQPRCDTLSNIFTHADKLN